MSYKEFIYSLHPDTYTDRLEKESSYADIGRYKDAMFGIGIASFLLIALIGILLPYDYKFRLIFILIAGITSYFFFPYILISLAAERRKKEMERVLPDALLLISTNLKSGASINRALLASAREEFGPLQQELRKTAIQISGGKSVQASLENLRGRVKSEIFSDTLNVLSDAIESGGNTAELLESSAEDIRSSLELREEIKSSIRMYVIFILIASVFGAPVLFSITVYMAETTTQMWEETDINSGGAEFASGGETGLSFQEPDVNTDFLVQFSVMALLITNFFASLIISQIGNGNLKEGAKYIPFTVSISIAIFLGVKSALNMLL